MKNPATEYEVRRLHALKSLEIFGTSPEENFDETTELVCRLLHAPMAAITLVGEEKIWFKSSLGIEATELPRNDTFCSFVATNRESLVVPNAQLDVRFSQLPAVAGPPHLSFYAGEPIIDDNGYVLGAVCAMDFRPREISLDQQKTLKMLARNVYQQMKLRKNILVLESKNPSLGKLHSLTQSYLDRSRYEVAEIESKSEGISYLLKNKSIVRTCSPRGHSLFRDKLEKALTQNAPVEFMHDQVKVTVEVVQRGRQGRNVFTLLARAA